MANRRGEQGPRCDHEGWALEPRDSVRSQTQAPGQGDGATGRPKLVRDVGRLLVPACGPLADTGWSWDSRGRGWGWGSMRRPLGHLKRQHGLAPLWPPPGPSAHWSWSSHSKVTIPGDRDTAGSGRELEGGQKQARCEKSLETLWAMWPTGLEPPSWSRTSKMENEPKNLFA